MNLYGRLKRPIKLPRKLKKAIKKQLLCSLILHIGHSHFRLHLSKLYGWTVTPKLARSHL